MLRQYLIYDRGVINLKKKHLCYSGLIIPMNHEELVECCEPWGKYPYILPGPGKEGLGSSRQTSRVDIKSSVISWNTAEDS